MSCGVKDGRERLVYQSGFFIVECLEQGEDVLDKAAVNAVADESLVVEYMSKGYLCRRE